MIVIGAPFTSRMVRADMIEVMASEYVQTARLLGISERRIILRHALPNALGPTIQIIATTMLWLLGGVIAIEIVFNYPGIGAELVRAVQIRDINFVQSTALILGVVFILINLVADLSSSCSRLACGRRSSEQRRSSGDGSADAHAPPARALDRRRAGRVRRRRRDHRAVPVAALAGRAARRAVPAAQLRLPARHRPAGP